MKHRYNEDQNLVLILDDWDIKTLKELEDLRSDSQMIEFLEDFTCNSELDWVDAQETGDLTDAPMLGIRNQDGEVVARWAFMDYQVTSVLDELNEKGHCVFVS